MIANLRRIAVLHDPEPVGLCLSGVALANALALLVLRPFGRSAAYEAMARVADEPAWAILLGGLAFGHLAAIVWDVRGKARVAAAIGNMLGLLIFTFAIIAPGPARWTSGVGIFAVLSGTAIWTAVRVGQRERDEPS